MKNTNKNINKNLLEKYLLKKTKLIHKSKKTKKSKTIQIACGQRTNIKFVLISVLQSAFPFRNFYVRKRILKQVYY